MPEQRRTPANYHPTQLAFLLLLTINAPRFKPNQIQIRGHVLPPLRKQARSNLANDRLPEDILLPNEKRDTSQTSLNT